MGFHDYQKGIDTIRARIESISNEKLKMALRYQYLICADKGEVAGNNRPIGYDVKKIELSLADSTVENVIFKIKENRTEKIRFCVLPYDDSIDPWVSIVYSYMSQFDAESPFSFHEKTSTSGSYFMRDTRKEFNGLSIFSPEYTRSRGSKVPHRPVSVTSKHLRDYRIHDLIFNYGFNSLDLALFFNWNDGSKIFSNEIKKIRAKDQSTFTDSDVTNWAIPYLSKLLKKNEIDDTYSQIITQVECYFILYCYFEIKNNEFSKELISETALLLNKSEELIIQLLNYTAYLDPSDDTEKSFDASFSQSLLLEQMYTWFSSNFDEARDNLPAFSNMISTDHTFFFTNLMDIKNESSLIYTEEGQSKTRTISMRQRSRALVYEARKQFRELDAENKLRCFACDYVKNDSIKNEIVEIHHLTPIKDLDKSGEQRILSDVTQYVLPLCPTCHRIAHSGSILLSLDRIKTLRD